jgi:hypothetical protein
VKREMRHLLTTRLRVCLDASAKLKLASWV